MRKDKKEFITARNRMRKASATKYSTCSGCFKPRNHAKQFICEHRNECGLYKPDSKKPTLAFIYVDEFRECRLYTRFKNSWFRKLYYKILEK